MTDNAGAVQADAAGFHDRQLGVARQQAEGHEDGEQRGNRDDIKDELRRPVEQEPADFRGIGLPLENLVGAVQERGDVEEAKQGEERQPDNLSRKSG